MRIAGHRDATAGRPATPGAHVLKAGLVVVLLGSGSARAQVIERNLPPAPRGAAPQLVAPPAVVQDPDATPIGPPIASIVLLGPDDPVRTGSAAGIDLGADARIDTRRSARILGAFLGQPISRKAIAQVQATIVRLHRRQGFPLVSVLLPEQEITSGSLQFRVVEFRRGALRLGGAARTPLGYVERSVRLPAGAPIDAGALAQDLDWLNRNPFRQIGVQFALGAGPGLTDVDLVVTERRPWRLYGGLATSGSAATGRARLFAGVQAAGLPGIPDALASYQLTASPDAAHRSRPEYVSHAASLTLPLAPRRAIEITYNHVDTSQPVRDFVVRSRVDEATLGFRAALPAFFRVFGSAVRADGLVGVEARRTRQRLLFGGVEVNDGAADVVQLYAGTVAEAAGRLGRTGMTATLHVSPGGIGRRNSDEAFARFSGRADASARYAYVNGQLSRFLLLPRGFAMTGEWSFQYAERALPRTETIAVGGPNAVRGYALDDGGFDSAVIGRATLLLPPIPRAGARLGSQALQPRLFVDAGYGKSHGDDRGVTPVSAGFGADYRLGGAVQLGVDAGCPLRSAAYTRALHCRLDARLSVNL